ncbi:MAG: serine hydrolase, partial [Pseudomonadota bacterium]
MRIWAWVVGVAMSASAMPLPASALAETTDATDAPLGLWVWNAPEDTAERRLIIEHRDGNWRASVDGEDVPIAVEDNDFTVSAGNGETFVGRFADGERPVDGYWHQPSTDLNYSEVATRATLQTAGDGVWETNVTPQPRPFAIFLDVFLNEDGEVAAAIRNPERNEIAGATRFRVEPGEDGDGIWTLAAERRGREVRHRMTRGEDGRLMLNHPSLERDISMTRATADEAERYRPRSGDASAAQYRAPSDLDDGWTVASAEDFGFDRTALDEMVSELATADPRASRPQLLHALLVAHKGRLVVEEYFHGHDAETPHDTRSLAKVFGSVMVGAMREDGIEIDADMHPVADVLARAGVPLDDPRKADISLAHLMSYSSGLDCSEDDTSAGSEDRMWTQGEETDFWLFSARLPQLHDPGTRYAYCSGSANLVGAALNAASGERVPDLFDRLIADPLDFGPYHWNLAPNGAGYLGGGVYARPRDLLKIGAMYAAGGVWNGKRIIGEDWITRSTTGAMPITPATTGLSPEDFANNYSGGDQAYIWGVGEVNVGDRSYRSYQASGNGGQILVVVPELEIAAVLMGGNYRMYGVWG